MFATLLVIGCPDRPAESDGSGQTVVFTSGDVVQPREREVVFQDGSVVEVEVVADPETRAQGLMYRPSLSPDRGMLFLFPAKAKHEFWMKNTIISLDIVWLDETRTVVHVEADVPPCLADPCPGYAPDGEALHVLELAAGQVAARAIRIGDVLEYRGGIENIVAR